MNARVLRTSFLVLFAGFILTPCPVFAGFFDDLLSSVTVNNSSSSSGGQVNQTLANSQQSLSEDRQRLDQAYSELRQKQAAGQDVTADLENINRLEMTAQARSNEVRQLRRQARQEASYQQMNQMRANQQQLDQAYYQLRQKQAAGQDTTQDLQNINYLQQQINNERSMYGNSGYGNNGYSGNGYRRRSGFSNDPWDDNGFRRSRYDDY